MTVRGCVQWLLMSSLGAGCNGSRPAVPSGEEPPAADSSAFKVPPRINAPGGVTASRFMARCQKTPGDGGLIARLVDEAMGKERGEVVWGDRANGGGSGDTGRDLTSDYGGHFIFLKNGSEHRITADDADAILRALRTGLLREMKASGVRLTKDTATEKGKRVTGFHLEYEDPDMPVNGSVEGSITLPTGERSIERLAVLKLTHHVKVRNGAP